MSEMFSPDVISAFLQVIMIDLVLAGDNAIVIGLAAAGLPKDQRTKAILIGVVAATVLRIIFALLTTKLLAIIGLLLAGGVLAPTYSSLLVPGRTGRETWVGPFSWTPDWEQRATAVNDLFEGRLTTAQARAVVIKSRARWLFADCRPLATAVFERQLAPLLAALRRRPQPVARPPRVRVTGHDLRRPSGAQLLEPHLAASG